MSNHQPETAAEKTAALNEYIARMKAYHRADERATDAEVKRDDAKQALADAQTGLYEALEEFERLAAEHDTAQDEAIAAESVLRHHFETEAEWHAVIEAVKASLDG